MNRLYIKTIAFAAVSAMLLGSCSQEQSTPDGAGIKTAHFGDQTRVEFNEITGKFAWSDPDEIALHLSSGEYTNVTVKASGVFNLTMDAGVTQDAYAVYPSNVVDPANYGNPDLKIALPAAYTVEGATGMEDWYPTPMIAVNNPKSDDLWFYHAGGAARLIMDDVPAGTASIEVNFGKRVTGSFTVNNPSTATPTIETEASADNTTVTFNLATALAAETDDYILNVPVPTGKYTSLEVVMKDAGGSALATHNSTRVRSFYRARGRKIHIPFIETEDEYFLELTPPAAFSQYGGPGVFSIRSYKTDESGETFVDFEKVEFSEDGGTTWSEELPTWLRLVDAEFSSDGLSIDCDLDAAINRGVPSKVWSGPTTYDQTIVTDLSMQDIYGNPIAQSTANCYVVSAPGWYKFPAVYGNAIKGGAPNEIAYHSQSTEPDALVNFVRHDGNPIEAAWIRDNGILLSDACLVWQDEMGLVSQISYADDYVTFFVDPETIKQGNAVIAVRDVDQKIAWSWHIWVMDSPAQKLATKTVYPELYYTRDAETPRHVMSSVYPLEMMDMNLGWCEAEDVQAVGRSVLVRVTQEESDLVKQCEVTQDPNDAYTSHGNNTFFQWGRKDPMLAAKGDGTSDGEDFTYDGQSFHFDVNASKGQYYEEDDYKWRVNDSYGGVTIAQAIQTPFIMYKHDYSIHNDTWILPSADGLIHSADLWNAIPDVHQVHHDPLDGEKDSPVVKTVYDPCPVGFTVPNTYAFNGFVDYLTSDNTVTLAANLSTYATDWGFQFYTDYWGVSGTAQAETTFFPYCGTRFDGYCLTALTVYHTACPERSSSSSSSIEWMDQAIGLLMSGSSVYAPFHISWDQAVGGAVRPVREVDVNPGMIFTGNAGSYGHDGWN